jgi:hypothetical protein
VVVCQALSFCLFTSHAFVCFPAPGVASAAPRQAIPKLTHAAAPTAAAAAADPFCAVKTAKRESQHLVWPPLHHGKLSYNSKLTLRCCCCCFHCTLSQLQHLVWPPLHHAKLSYNQVICMLLRLLLLLLLLLLLFVLCNLSCSTGCGLRCTTASSPSTSS